MIKILALLTMLVDHLGAAFFYKLNVMRMIGRFSMPLFAYCVARSFNHYSHNGNMKKYFRNLTIFAFASQIPFVVFCIPVLNVPLNQVYKIDLNIGFTWLCSLILMWALFKIELKLDIKNLLRVLIVIAVCLFSSYVPLDYNLYGVLYPVVFYIFCFKIDSPILLLVSSSLIYILDCLRLGVSLFGRDQILAIFAVFLIYQFRDSDSKFRLPKGFFYWFYGAHLLIFGLVNYGLKHHLFNIFI